MMDEKKDLNTFKKEWYAKAEQDSENLFSIAEDAVARDPNLNVVIVKRLHRFDRTSKDIMGIKSQLSKFANHVYDQLWLKRGSPPRIRVVELDLGCDNYPYLKDIIYGKQNDSKFDGIHLIGNAAKRHFTYRAVQAVSSIITEPFQYNHQSPRARAKIPATYRAKSSAGDHTDCEQARHQRQSASNEDKEARPRFPLKTGIRGEQGQGMAWVRRGSGLYMQTDWNTRYQ
jgi:hypothetical protein